MIAIHYSRPKLDAIARLQLTAFKRVMIAKPAWCGRDSVAKAAGRFLR